MQGTRPKKRTSIPKKNLEIPEAYIDIIRIMYYNWTVLKRNAEFTKRHNKLCLLALIAVQNFNGSTLDTERSKACKQQ